MERPGDDLDVAVVDDLKRLAAGGGDDLLADLARLFEESVPKALSSIRDAISAGDPAGLAQVAHLLKSSSASLGGRLVASTCQQLETLGRAGDFSGVDDLVVQLTGQLERFIAEFKAATGGS